MHAALVIMAAGLASRYGSVKQIERVGPGGEILMEYAIYDALEAGFDRIVVIVRPDMAEDMEALVGARVRRSAGIAPEYALQSASGDWRGIPIPAGRTKPLGTIHALLCAEEYLNRPFAVINADDFYGRDTIAVIGAALPALQSGRDSVMAAYRLANTVSPFGAVTRGVCAGMDGELKSIAETQGICLLPDGRIRAGENGPLLPPDAPVSMNIWGFHPEILQKFDERFTAFLRALPPGDNKSECLLPVVMDSLLSHGEASCRMLRTDDHWFGLTYAEDKAGVKAELKKLHDAGVYPPSLWGVGKR